MAPVIGDIIRAVAKFQFSGGDIFTNTFHFEVFSEGWNNDLQFMTELAVFMDAQYTLVNTRVSSALTYVDLDGQNLTQDILMPSVPWPVLVNGGSASEPLPTQTTARPFFRTLRPKTRASICYIPFDELSSTAGGVIVAAAAANLASWATPFISVIALVSGSITYGAYNRPLDRFTPVTSFVVPTRLRTIRRRRIGVGS